jgi:hypothetical protein
MEGDEETRNLRGTGSSRWDDTEDTSIFTELWKTGAWRLFPLMLIYVASELQPREDYEKKLHAGKDAY